MKKKLFALIMTLCMLALPLSGMAAPGQERVTYDNFYYDVMGESGDIDMSVTLTSGETEDGRVYAQIEGTGGQRPIGKATVALEGDAVKLWIDGLTDSYTITPDGVAQLLKQSGMPDELDAGAIVDIIRGYYMMIRDAGDPEFQAKLEAQMPALVEIMLADAEISDVPVEGEVMGDTFDLYRMHFTLDSDDLDAYMNAYAEASQGVRLFLDGYARFVAKALELDEVTGGMFGLLKRMGLTYDFDITMWLTESGDAVIAEIGYTMNMDVEGVQQTVLLPFSIQARSDGGSERMMMDMTMAMDVEGARMNYQVNMESGDGVQSMSVVMDAIEYGQSVMSVLIEGEYAVDDAGGETLGGAMRMSAPDAKVIMNLSYGGTLSETERAGQAVFSLDGTVIDGTPVSAEWGFDIAHRFGDADASIPDALDQLPSIAIEQVDEAQLEALEKQLMRAGLTAVGGVMQTPGVAEIIAKLQPLGSMLPFEVVA